MLNILPSGELLGYATLKKGTLVRESDDVTFKGTFRNSEFLHGIYTSENFSIEGEFQKFKYWKKYKSKYLITNNEYNIKQGTDDNINIIKVMAGPHIFGTTNTEKYVYTGSYNNLFEPNGNGKIVWFCDNHYYEGDFSDGQPYGKGKYFTHKYGLIPVRAENGKYVLDV